jgi:hypothetical protein
MFCSKQVMIGTSKSIWGFDPRSVPGCQLWLDGNDPAGTGTLPANGATVSTWVDKSGNGANGTAVGTTPIFASGGGITFSAGAYNSSYSSSLTNESLFVVFRYTRTSGTLSLVGQTGDGARLLALGGGASTAQLQSSVYNVAVGALSLTTTVPINTIGLGELITTNSTMAIFYNGTSVGTPTAVTFTAGRTSVIGGASNAGSINTSQYFGGTIHEVVGFTGALTTSQRQQIEGYLAHKWGLSGYYNSSTPLSIPGCALWLDGADPAGTGTQPANGATVSTWVDKSGNGYNATAAPSRVAGTYSTSFRAVNFPTSSTGYITNYSAAPTNETMFVVFNNPSPGPYNLILIGGVQGARSLGAGYTASGGSGTVGNLNTQVAWLATTGTYTAGTTVLTTSQFTTSTNSISLNGGTAASGGAPGFTAGRVTYLGVDATDASFYYVGYAMEILFYNSALTTTQRQTIEGYLARKWGIGSSILPSTHPFYSIRPHLRTFQPIDITGCQLWLDGADPAGTGVVPVNGTTISTWVDKSGNGRNATPTGTGPTYTTNIFNGYSAPVFNGTTMVTPSYLISTDSKLSIFVLCKKTGLRAGGNSDILSIAAGYYYFDLYIRSSVNNYLEVYYQNTPVSLTTYAIGNGTNLLVSILTNGLSIDGYLNGTSVVSTSLPSSAYSMNNLTSQWRISEAQFVGPICEVIIFNSTFTTTQRQTIEGYLAQKWGLTLSGQFPSTHPFSKFPPSSVPNIIPLAIATVTLTSLTTSSGTINWTTTNASGYIWYVGTGAGSGQVATGTITNRSTLTATVTYAFALSTLYYAWVIPYNLDGLGPTTFSLASSISSGFSPTSITGLQLWLDGNDPAGTGTQPANGATVSTWVDKSGNGYNATAAPSRIAGTYSTAYNAVNFATSSTGYITTYSAAPTNETMFVVFNNPSPSSANNIIIGGVQGARSLGAGYTADGLGTVGNLNTQVAWLARTGSYTSGTTMLVTSKFTTSTNTVSLNGGVNTASGGAPGFTAGRVTYLGVDATDSFYHYVGYGMEILFYNSVLSTLQTQQIEGYLAHKWGIQSSLPAGHPYKTTAP